MKKFMILHFGFKMPSSEEMAEWNKWFDSISDRVIEKAHFPQGREFTNDGTVELPMAEESITGYTMIKAKDLAEAGSVAGKCPIVISTRVYEIQESFDS